MPLKMVTAEGEELAIHSPSDFEKRFSLRYLSSLEYKDEKTERLLEKRYKKASEKGWVTSRQKWLGHYYAEGLCGKIPLDLTIKWLDAQVGYGVFTNRPVAAHACVGEYVGVIRKRRFFRRWENLYCFDYTVGEKRSTSYVIDAQDAGNHVRFINHSFDPNLGLVSVDFQGQIHVILYAAKAIAAGDQLLYDYGDDYWQKRADPIELERKLQN